MKNFIFSLILSAAIIGLNGCDKDPGLGSGINTQPIFFDQFYNPIVGDQFTFYNVDTNVIYTGGTGDTIFDFSSIIINHLDSNGMIYVAPSSTPYSTSFLNATVASHTLNNSTVFGYYNCNTFVYQNLGIGSAGFTLVYSDPQSVLIYTLSQGTAQTDHFSGQETISGIVHYISGDYTINFDAKGTLILPPINGHVNYNNNCARVHHYQTYKDSSSIEVINSTDEGYQWWSPIIKFPLFNYNIHTVLNSQIKSVWINKQVSP